MLLVPSNATPLIFLVVANFVAEAAFPFILPSIVLVTVKFDKVPTDVKLELTTVEFKEVPVSVPAFAAIVISPVPSNATPFIFMEVANFVVVAEFPVVDWLSVGKSDATAILGTPVPVVFFKIPVSRYFKRVPFIPIT